ncbi:hypothetical protein C8R42DRAFT_39239 [Lentinula raphanica]|nr:hypothetical protein C8R42DRAFT_39239 [Lentinula raphanica]
MAVPIPMRTISVALLLLLLLASALQPGLLAAPTASSVPVPMPPIEQDIDRRAGTIEVPIYGVRRLDSSETGYAKTRTAHPMAGEWLQLRAGKRQILHLKPVNDRMHWNIKPIPQGIENPPPDDSIFLIGTVRCPSPQVVEQIFGSPIDHPGPDERGLIHIQLEAEFEIQDPAKPGDFTWAALQLLKRFESFAQQGILVAFEKVCVQGTQKTVLDRYLDDCWEANGRLER